MAEIRNPNLEPRGGAGGGNASGGDFRSLMVFTFVALAVLLGFQYFRPKTEQPSQQPAQNQTRPQNLPQPSAAGPAVAGQVPASAAAVVASAESEITIENELYKIVFTNRGAQVKHWILKNYSDTAGKPLDMVQPQAAAAFGYPLSLYTYEPALTQQLNQALYQSSATGRLTAPASLTFRYAQNGIEVEKTFSFDASYVVQAETRVVRNGATVRALVAWPSTLGDLEEFLPSSDTRSTVRMPSQFVWSVGDKHDSMASSKVSGNATLDQPYDYAGLTDLYFAVAMLPAAPQHTTVVTFHNSLPVASDLSNPASEKKPDDVLGLAMGDSSGATTLRLFVGPKQTDVLKTVHAIGPDGRASGPTIEPLIQYGWLGVIAKPLYLALRWLHGLLGPGLYNWGWAIIIVTCIFNLLMLPTRLMMMKQSVKMARLQPKIDALKRRFAHLKMNDPKRAEMNAEMMELYKTEGVNLYGGCLPMLLQMPLFFAYYRVLLNAVELRQAHWFWLTDLSNADPSHVLPLLIILTMFLTQYITPSPGMDASQRRMMAIVMPVFMGFILWHYASGLALYWITGNLINLTIQLAINRSAMGRELHEIAARRAAKKGGNGSGPRTIQGRR